HLLVIAFDQHHLTLVAEANDPLEHLTRFLALVDQVAQEHDPIAGRRFDRLQHFVEGMHAAVHIADGDRALRFHKGNPLWENTRISLPAAQQYVAASNSATPG